MENKKEVLVSILMGSDSDWTKMMDAAKCLKEFGVSYDARVLSAHRTPEETKAYVKQAEKEGVRVIIAGAGCAAHLAGAVSAYSSLPVIGVPISSSPLKGQDSLLSTVQMPRGVPVGTVAIDNSWNAALLAIQILSHGGKSKNDEILDKFLSYKKGLREKTLSKKISL